MRWQMALALALPVAFVCGTVALLAAQEQLAPAWRPLMDGQTLKGWHTIGDGSWTVENGEFVGRANNEKLYGLLVSDWSFGNFSLRLKFKCSTGDSGVYIRTLFRPPDEAHGLQVQVGPLTTGAGGIYESYGRGWISKPTAEQEKAYLKPDDWNAMAITARGGDVTVEVNGVKASEIKGDTGRPEGELALQMHSGTAMEVRFKDIEILEG
jgi:3-keto-disaccharide hydrolase